MNKEQRATVVEYIFGLADDEVRLLYQRLVDKFFGDLAEALNTMSKNQKMDLLLGSTESANALYELLDKIRDVIGKECKKKLSNLK